MCQRTTAEYEEELCPTKEEKERQHEKHQVVLHRTDIHQLIGHQEECLPHLQGDSFTLEYPQLSNFKGDKEVPQPPYFKEEEGGECPVGQEEADVSKFPLTVVSVKTEEHEDKPPESSQLHHSPINAKKKKRAKKKVSADKSAAKGKKSDAQAGHSSSSPKKSRAGSKSKAIVMDSSTDDEKHGEEEKVTARDKWSEKEEESLEKELKTYLQDKVCTWIFNPPNSSHMGGVWERLIGITRRILDALLLKEGGSHLSHEVLTTLMAEVMAIMNARPLIPVSTDPEMPAILTPATLLTLKRDVISAPPGDFNVKDIHSQQWRKVQSLSDRFWKRWKQEYLSTIQTRRRDSAERRCATSSTSPPFHKRMPDALSTV
ncbi:uncharacterized protein LOC133542089 isoform X2 [Nerophis ophidion]|uniref:uncharacterized protein LOC133542089 isoform X2 n=1 Tax=Nerophis ophidion TaxID=159077 RepID=UPI002ADF9551|nr:uncharacterized protein LOC133542089 isoform X2 [Nerophis ophidion]